MVIAVWTPCLDYAKGGCNGIFNIHPGSIDGFYINEFDLFCLGVTPYVGPTTQKKNPIFPIFVTTAILFHGPFPLAAAAVRLPT
jgi:hypothetical protein